MQAIKVGWFGQSFGLVKCSDSRGKKPRSRKTKEERKAMVEVFIKKYRTSNNGSFPSLNLTHKEVGGSFYTVREIVREMIQENRVLGPAISSSEGQTVVSECHNPLSLSSAFGIMNDLSEEQVAFPDEYVSDSEKASGSTDEIFQQPFAEMLANSSADHLVAQQNYEDHSNRNTVINGITQLQSFNAVIEESTVSHADSGLEDKLDDLWELNGNTTSAMQDQTIDSKETFCLHGYPGALKGPKENSEAQAATLQTEVDASSIFNANARENLGSQNLGKLEDPLSKKSQLDETKGLLQDADQSALVANARDLAINAKQASCSCESSGAVKDLRKSPEAQQADVSEANMDDSSILCGKAMENPGSPYVKILDFPRSETSLIHDTEGLSEVAGEGILPADARFIPAPSDSPSMHLIDATSTDGHPASSVIKETSQVHVRVVLDQNSSSRREGDTSGTSSDRLEKMSQLPKTEEANPFWALIKSFITSFVKFWME